MKGSNRPKLVPVSEEMKAWSSALKAEMAEWPQVTARSSFGLTALYRNEQIFALLPRTRGMETPNSLAFRLDSPSPAMRVRLAKDRRIGSAHMQKARWFTFEMSSDADLHNALGWLGRAYEVACKAQKSS